VQFSNSTGCGKSQLASVVARDQADRARRLLMVCILEPSHPLPGLSVGGHSERQPEDHAKSIEEVINPRRSFGFAAEPSSISANEMKHP
jgi:hypothetical protein